MSLTVGARLGPYEITGAIGAGGMGEVYRARDTRLDRSVAIKVLPPALTANADRRARFEREARTLASLSHPRICTLFDVGEHHGSTFLVMEHLQGETLADRIFRGPLPVASALEIAVQIAEGLDAAHKRGIVHRDLKPANVMLTKSGATLLDFGLAKLRGHGESPALTLDGNAPTESESLTKEGTILGTLQYMAPEQLQGKEADAHADLWALGVMLYEMVSGKRPFTGDNPASLMGAILERDPPSLATALPVSPPSLDRLLRRCLAKSPDERWESARDLGDELRWIAQDVERGEPQGASAAARPLWRRVGLPIALGIATVLATFGVTFLWRPATTPASRPVVRSMLDVRPADEVRSAVDSAPLTRTSGGSTTAFDWTPDGRALVFAGRQGDTQQLFVRQLDRETAQPLAGTEGARAPVVSPDGKWVAFWADGAIRKIPLAGGPATVVANEVYYPSSLAWGESGTLLYDGHTSGSAIWRVRAGGTPEPLTTLAEGEVQHLTPRFLPGDEALLFTVRRRARTWGDEEIVAQVGASGKRTVLLHNATDARYLPTGHLLFSRFGTLFAVPFDPVLLAVKGEPVALLDEVSQALTAENEYDISGAAQLVVSRAGDLAYIAGPLVPFVENRLVTVDRAGRVEPLPAPERNYALNLSLSPDGLQLAIPVRSATERGLWIYDLSRRTLTPLTSPGTEVNWPRWSPDGQKVAYAALRTGIQTAEMIRADGSSPAETLVRQAALPSSWAPDGRELAVVRDGSISMLDVAGNPPQLQPLATVPNSGWPAFSPDGRWLAFAGGTDETQIYLQPYPGPGPRLQVSVHSAYSLAWNPNGREIFFVDTLNPPQARMMSVTVTLGAAPNLGAPRQLFEFNWEQLWLGCFPLTCFAVAPDGQRFYAAQVVKTDPPTPVTQIHLVQNWLAELEAKVPSGR